MSVPPRMGHLVRRSLATMTGPERARVMAMYGAILGLHVAGFVIFLIFVVPSHYKGLGIGVSVLAYTLGLKHAVDADHIAAIDNTTRKLMNEGRRSLAGGLWFSLGHSTVVVLVTLVIALASDGARERLDGLKDAGALIGTAVSVLFLVVIGLGNLVVLARLW